MPTSVPTLRNASIRTVVLAVATSLIATLLAALILDPPKAAAEASGDRAVLLVVDVSGSMEGQRLEQARAALTSSVDALRDSDRAGLRSYAGSCGAGGQLLVAPATDNRGDIKNAIAGLSAGGGTPTPDALRAAVGDFPADASEKLLILVSDGESTCGDPCAVAASLKNDEGIDFKAYTVGFNATAGASDELGCIARVTGGQYFDATDTGSLQTAIDIAISGGTNNGLPASAIYGSGNASSNASVACAGDPVNCATGNFTLPGVDISVPVRGPGLESMRTYNALAADESGLFGHGWSSSYDMALTEASDGTVTVRQENGSEVVFTKTADDSYTAPDWVLATLERTADGWRFERRQETTFAFDDDGRLITATDRNGEQTTFDYDATGLTSVSASGRSITVKRDAAGRVVTLTAPMSRAMTYRYDGAGDLVEVTNPLGATVTYSYDADHRMTSWVDANGAATTNVYDDAGRVTEQTDALGATTTWSYEGQAGNGVTTITGADGRTIVEEFSQNLMVRRTAAAGTPLETTTRYTYDPATLGVATITDGLGRQTRIEHDANGHPTETTAPGGQVTKATYDDYGNVLTTTDAAGNTASYAYDDRGNLIRSSMPTSAGEAVTTLKRSADHPDDIVTAVDPEGRTTTFAYDEHGDLVRTTDPAGKSTSITYNEAGEPLTSTDRLGRSTRIERNALGLVTTITDPSGATTTSTYDVAGRVTAITDPAKKTVRFGYDALGRQVTTELPDGTTSSATFNQMGELTSQVDQAGRTTTYGYNARGEAASTTLPGGITSTVSYDAAGQPISARDALGRTSSWSYDANGQLTGIDYSDPATPDVSFAYDDRGLRTLMTDGTGTSRYEYGPAGELTSYVNGAGQRLAYTYDTSGLVTALTYPGDKTVTYRRDGLGRIDKVTDWRDKSFGYGYDASGQLVQERAPNSTITSYDYDKRGLPTSIKVTTTLGLPVMSLGSGRDTLGQVTSEIGSTGLDLQASGFGYDEVNQLASSWRKSVTGWNSTSYSSTNGELTGSATVGTAPKSSALTLGDGGQVTQQATTGLLRSTSTTYAYDAAGQRSQAQTAGVKATYGYAQSGRMTSYAGPLGGAGLSRVDVDPLRDGLKGLLAPKLSDTKVEASYVYDGDGVRASKTVDGKSTAFLYNPLSGSTKQLMVQDGTAFVYGPGGRVIEQLRLEPDRPKYPWQSADYNALYLHADQLGSTRVISDEHGKPVQSLNYSAYGTLLESDPLHVLKPKTPILYAGGYLDAESGLYYLINRHYDPATAQFVSVDPLAPSSGSMHGYAGFNPINFADPSGLWPDWNWGKIGASVAVIGVATAATACIVATAGICAPIAAAGTLATGAAVFGIGATTGAALYRINEDCRTWGGYAKAALIEGAANVIGFGAGKLITKGLAARGATTGAANAATRPDIAGARFAQKSYSEMFSSGGRFAGQSIDDVAGSLRSGALSPKDVPIDVIVRDGNSLILNTRSSQALIRAGVPRSSWNVIDRTGQAAYESRLTGQLTRNGLSSYGTELP